MFRVPSHPGKRGKIVKVSSLEKVREFEKSASNQKFYHVHLPQNIHTHALGFHYETYSKISPFRTLSYTLRCTV